MAAAWTLQCGCFGFFLFIRAGKVLMKEGQTLKYEGFVQMYKFSLSQKALARVRFTNFFMVQLFQMFCLWVVVQTGM